MPIPTDKELITASLNNIITLIKKQNSGSPASATSLLDDSQLHELQRIKNALAPHAETEQYVEHIPKCEPENSTNSNTAPTEQARRVTRSMAQPQLAPNPINENNNGKSNDGTQQPTNAALQASYSRTERVLGSPLLRVGPQKSAANTTTGRFGNAIALMLADAPEPPILNLPHDAWTETCYKAIHPDTGELVEYKQLIKSSEGYLWEECCAEEIGRLAQGYKCVAGTDTIHFIKVQDIPSGRKPTYLRLVVADKPNKENPRRVRFTAGGDQIKYPGEVSTKTSGMHTAKILLNSVISTPSARFCAFDIKDFYLNTPMERYEYMRIPLHQIPKEIYEQYNLQEITHNGFVYVEIRKGIYGLPQAGILANTQLIELLATHGYHQCTHTHGLFTHTTRPISFTLVVDDFGVKYIGIENAEHLLGVLQSAYEVTHNWNGDKFLNIKLDWDYQNGTVDLSMPGYIEKALQRFQHENPTKPEHSPHRYIEPQYGAPVQYTEPTDESEPLNKAETKLLQEIIGTLLYYARAIDSTMLVALSSLASAQANGTQETAKACTKLLNYAATHPEATIRYKASDMILHIHSDASYLSKPKARSRVGGFFFLGTNTKEPPINGAIHVISQIRVMMNVMASAAEAEVGGLFINGQGACPLCMALEEMGHPQLPTIIVTNNQWAEGIANETVKQKRSKAIDMRFYWIRD